MNYSYKSRKSALIIIFLITMTEITYNFLPHILEAQHREMPKVGEIKDVLVKYGLSDLLGIVRLHKHFDLEKDEKVVWSFHEKSGFSCVKRGNYSPYVLKFTSTSELIPTEFYEGSDVWAELLARKDFPLWSQEILEIIGKEIGLYGLILNLTNFGNELELTNEKQRTQKIIARELGIKEEGEATTKFYADNTTAGCNHCNHCNHCSHWA